MFKNRLFRKLIATYLVLIVASLGLLSIVAINKFSQSYQEEISQHLENTAYTVRAFVKDCPVEPGKLSEHINELVRDIQTRITVIDKDGNVLADSSSDRSTMENHNDRPEVLSARQKKLGQNIRYSHTLAIDMIYLAIPLDNNKPDDVIIRVALPLKQVSLITGQVYQTVAITFVFALLIALVMGLWLVSRIVRPVREMASVAESISQGDFSRQITARTGDEIGALADAVNLMSNELQQRFTEIREKSNTLNTILSTISDGIITIDKNLKIIFANAAAGKLLDFDTGLSVGKYLWEIVRHDQFNRFIKESMNVSSKCQSHIDILSSTDRQLRIYCTPIKEIEDDFVVVIYDITEQNRYEQLRKDFVANVSHELRTPLTSIKGYVETLKDEGLNNPVKAKEFLAIIENNTNQLTNLVEDLLEISRLESKAGIARIKPTSLPKLIERIINNFQPAITQKRHHLVNSVPSDSLTLDTDPNLLEKAISNLVDNAIKYTHEGGRIEIIVAPESDRIVISVKDNGLGIPEEDLGRVFERFYRVDKSRSREMGGTGLGLSIVKHIVQTLKGEVTVTSQPNQGSTFVIKLPM